LLARGIGRDAFGETQRAVEHLAQAIAERRRDRCGFIQQFQKCCLQCLVRAALADGAGDDVERVDVAGAFPEHADMGVTNQPRLHPFLDVAVAAADFHGTGRHRNVVAAGAEF